MAAATGIVFRCPWTLGLAGLRALRELRCVPSGGISTCFLKNRAQQGKIFPVRLFGNDSALHYILGISGEETKCKVGQHPPPVSAFKEEQDNLLGHQPDQPENPKVLRIAVIGAPNAGKSTLSNQLLGRKVILDTPGLTTSAKAKRHNLEKSLLYDPLESLKSADLGGDMTSLLASLIAHAAWHPLLLHLLTSVLVLNKVDLLKKKALLLDLVTELTEGVVDGKKLNIMSVLKSVPASNSPSEDAQVSVTPESTIATPGGLQVLCESQAGSPLDAEASRVPKGVGLISAKENTGKQKRRARKGWPHFQEIFMLAAVNGEEVETLKRYLLMQAKPGPWEFHSEVLTSQSPQEICDNVIREKLLEYLPEEVPYTVVQRTEAWEEGPGGELVILQNLLVQKETHMKMLIGQHGQLISKIASEAGHDLMDAFLCDVRLKLCVKLKK
ncbi:hypothetical protein lerEdw1_002707 [Lerista edwardsae]|nr:hypothetical protein lerEdw1_002707 [Lerista edwardsae]